MSKDISIKEGDLSRQFGHISKLNIANSGGGSSLWVPEEDVETKSLHVTKNGTYLADASYIKTIKTIRNGKVVYVPVRVLNEENSCYGFAEVNVDIIDNVNGYDDDGHLKNIGVGDNDYLVESRIPSYIDIIQEPTTTHYVDGQDISIEGIKVKAYYEDGTEWGDVPFEELSFEPKTAHMSQEKQRTSSYVDGVIYARSAPLILWFAGSGRVLYENYTCDAGAFVNTWAIAAYKDDSYGGQSITLEGKTAWYTAHSGSFYPDATANVTRSLVTGDNHGYWAWTMLYGSTSGSDDEVTVSWDNEILEEPLTDIYKITVSQGPIPPNGENTGGGGADTDDGTNTGGGIDIDHPITPHI